jgi:subtilisin-like proprotein convertase family protein
MPLLAALSAHATLHTEALTNMNTPIPDGNPVGVVFSANVSDAPPGWIVGGVTVTLNLTGGYNGDLYAYLVAPNGTLVVLINQPGAAIDGFGASGAGMDVTLQDGANDHGSIQDETNSAVLTGTYNAAGTLANMNGSSADGTWTLFLGDLVSGGGTSVLNSWSLGITAVAEPVTVTLALHTGTGSSSTYGDSLSFDVTVSGTTPTGGVTLYDGGGGGTVIGNGTLSGGACTITPALNALAAGAHTNIIACYGGDPTFAAGMSAALSPQTVAQKTLSITGVTASGKVYDATTSATINDSGAALSGVVSGDAGNVTLSATGASGSFANACAGANMTVNTAGFTISGSASGNYSLTQPTLTAIITPKGLMVTGNLSVPSGKVYDGTTDATVSGAAALLSAEAPGSGSTSDGAPYIGDSVSLSGAVTAAGYNSIGAPNATTVTFDISGLSLTGAGSGNYMINPPSAVSASIAPLPVALNGTRSYDGTTAAAAAILSVANKIGGDDVTVVSGASVLASATSGVEGITSFGTLALGGSTAPDYTFSGGSGSVNVTQASASLTLGSSENPAGYNDSVAFTATLPSDATGSVVFKTNGVALSTNSITGGAALGAVTALLPRGTNSITAEYAGDNNYLGSTNSLTQAVTNHPPVAATMTVNRTAGLSLLIAFSDLSTNWTDADGDTVTLASLNLLTTNGIMLATNASDISYANGQNVNDQFSYTVSDGQGGTARGLVNIVVVASIWGQAQSVSVSNGTVTVFFTVVPGYSYAAQRSTNLVNWLTILTTNAPSGGVIQITDNFIDLNLPPSSAFYRLEWSP